MTGLDDRSQGGALVHCHLFQATSPNLGLPSSPPGPLFLLAGHLFSARGTEFRTRPLEPVSHRSLGGAGEAPRRGLDAAGPGTLL